MRGIDTKTLRAYPYLQTELNWLINNHATPEQIAHIRDQIASVDNYIIGIDDPLVRMALRLKFIESKSWLGVAMTIGGNNTADGVKKMCYRFLEKDDKKDEQ